MATVKDQLYSISPVLVQHLIVSTYGLYWNRLRFGGQFQSEYKAFREREWLSVEQWDQFVTKQLRMLLTSAYDYAPYYREAWSNIKRSHLEKFTVADLPNLAPLEKGIALNNPSSLLIGGKPQPSHRVFHTSGSSGTPIATYWLPQELQRSLALREARSCAFAGVSFQMPRATFSGRIVEPNPDSRGPFYRFNMAERQVYFSAFHIRPDTARLYLRALDRHNIQWITGYSNSIYQLAQLTQTLNLEAPKLKAVITTSEKITDEMRGVVEETFCTKVFEEYGAVEDLFYVCECEFGQKHINPDAGIIEIVDTDFNPVKQGEMGEVLATGFIRLSQPSIRYRIGDLAILDDKLCPCGRQMPVLKEVIGRIEDTIYAPDGRRMVRFHGIFVNQPHIQEGQIIQKRLNHIHVRVVPKLGFDSEDEEDIKNRIQQRLTTQMTVTIEKVDHIERTSSGKFKAVVNQMSLEERALFH